MEVFPLRIDSSADGVRIEFPWSRASAVRRSLLLLFLVGGACLSAWDLWPHRPAWVDPSSAALYLGFILFLIFARSVPASRYTVCLSRKGLTRRSELFFGMHWTSFYPLDELRNVRLRRNPDMGEPPKEWEFIFDRKSVPANVPVPLTQPEAQCIKDAIWSRFPQITPAQPLSCQL